MILSLGEIERRLADRNLSEVARRCGLHMNTVRKYALGNAKKPPHDVVRVLSAYLAGDVWPGKFFRPIVHFMGHLEQPGAFAQELLEADGWSVDFDIDGMIATPPAGVEEAEHLVVYVDGDPRSGFWLRLEEE